MSLDNNTQEQNDKNHIILHPRLKTKVIHHLTVTQDHVLQYEYFRAKNATGTETSSPELWVEIYNTETAAKTAIMSESNTGDEVPMDVEQITNLEILSDGHSKIVISEQRQAFEMMRLFVPLPSKANNGVLMDSENQTQTM